jgi:hypothetical protein
MRSKAPWRSAHEEAAMRKSRRHEKALHSKGSMRKPACVTCALAHHATISNEAAHGTGA